MRDQVSLDQCLLNQEVDAPKKSQSLDRCLMKDQDEDEAEEVKGSDIEKKDSGEVGAVPVYPEGS